VAKDIYVHKRKSNENISNDVELEAHQYNVTLVLVNITYVGSHSSHDSNLMPGTHLPLNHSLYDDQIIANYICIFSCHQKMCTSGIHMGIVTTCFLSFHAKYLSNLQRAHFWFNSFCFSVNRI